jgi:hypothetical protein
MRSILVFDEARGIALREKGPKREKRERQRSEVRRRRTECRRFKLLNIEQQNKEPQNDEVITSKFPPEADWIFCGLKRR